MNRILRISLGMLVFGSAVVCHAEEGAGPPNILLVIWGSARPDRMSAYGYDQRTTPFLEEWAQGGRVFEDCLSPASASTTAYASMLTGTLPSRNGVNYEYRFLLDEFTTLAELLSTRGYQTYMYSTHVGVDARENFSQGFDVVEHPWDASYMDDALAIVRDKVSMEDISSEIARKVHTTQVGFWSVSAAGPLVQEAAINWLRQRDPNRPYFAVLVYSDAHRPHFPQLEHRQRMLSPEQAKRSYNIVRTRPEIWKFTFGVPVYSEEDLSVIGGVYDACIAGLDEMFKDLLDLLKGEGLMENTAVVLTADHGELLGEHHMMGNDFALYQELIRVPMILHYPPRVQPGRDKSPVMNLDLFPTILQLAGIDPPKEDAPHAVSLLSPTASRSRVAEYPVFHRNSIIYVGAEYPDFPRKKWMRSLRSIVDGEFKLIWGSDGRHELYHLSDDPKETHNLIDDKPQVARRLIERLEQVAGPPMQVREKGQPATQPAEEEP